MQQCTTNAELLSNSTSKILKIIMYGTFCLQLCERKNEEKMAASAS